jgi:putative transposase
MPNYRRAKVHGGTYFFTVVTHGRAPLLADNVALETLGACFRECQERSPFTVDAIVVLPDHLHAIWSLPSGDADYSSRWAWIKKEFTKRRLAAGAQERSVSSARHNERRRGVWQPRFWEHVIEDSDDFDRHLDYIHFNPVKHGLVACPHEWQASSFHRWVRAGVYEREWACGGYDGVARRFAGMPETTGEVD